MTKSISKDGTVRRCVFSETVLLVNEEEEQLIYDIIDDKLKMKFQIAFTFCNEGSENSSSGNLSEDKKTINVTLHNWNSSNGVELKKALQYTTAETKKKVWIKYKTWADKKLNFRSFTLTVWGEE
ncbi:MAG: hypothetical protein V2A54_03265 [Bacteroidota bacterium]